MPVSDQEFSPVKGIFLFPQLPADQISKLAGYQLKSKKALAIAFSQVISKWERGTSAKETLRQAGLGELRVAMRLKELALQNESLAVAKDMTIHATKILDMVSPELGDLDGFAIMVHRPGTQGTPAQTGPGRAKAEAEEKERITE